MEDLTCHYIHLLGGDPVLTTVQDKDATRIHYFKATLGTPEKHGTYSKCEVLRRSPAGAL